MTLCWIDNKSLLEPIMPQWATNIWDLSFRDSWKWLDLNTLIITKSLRQRKQLNYAEWKALLFVQPTPINKTPYIFVYQEWSFDVTAVTHI